MEEIKAKQSRIPYIKDVVNYKDFFGEYPLIFAIKIISSISLIYVISEFYIYHNPLDTYITKHVKGNFTTFNPDKNVFVLWGFIAGFILYIFTLFKGKYKFLILILTIALVGQYISDPALDWKVGEHVIPSRIGEEGAEKWTWKPKTKKRGRLG